MSSSASARSLPIISSARESVSANTDTPAALRDLSDDIIMSRFQGGELAALEVLYDRYASLLLGIGRKLLRDASDAEDLVHDVFLYLFRKKQLFDPSKGSVRSWLIMATYSRAFNHHRYLKSRKVQGREDLENSESISVDNSNRHEDNPEDLFHWRSVFLQAFEELPEEQRQTLHLHFFEGYTLLEISHKLGHSFGNIRHYYYRGIDRLKQRLTENGVSSQET